MHVRQCIIINLHLSNSSMLCMNWKSHVPDHFYMFQRNLIHHSQMYIMWLLNLLRLQNCTQQLGREGSTIACFYMLNQAQKIQPKKKRKKSTGMRSSGHLHLHRVSHLEYQICTIHTKHRWILFKLISSGIFMSNCTFSQGPELSKWAPWAFYVQFHKNLNRQVNDGWEHHEQCHVFHASTWIKWWSVRPIPSTKREGEEQQTNSKMVAFFRGSRL
jgi:hypothetical protein